jgi:hypothetical protein
MSDPRNVIALCACVCVLLIGSGSAVYGLHLFLMALRETAGPLSHDLAETAGFFAGSGIGIAIIAVHRLSLLEQSWKQTAPYGIPAE